MHHEMSGHESREGDAGSAIDRVCGMTVEPAEAESKGLATHYQGTTYYFCGKGCKLEFQDDPRTYLDAAYTPSM